jgi:uncharacterized protein
MRAQTYLFVTLLLIAAPVGLAQTSLPKPTGRVNDFAAVIAPDVESELDAQLASLENTTSHEVAVVTVRSLDGMTVEDYAERLFRAWGIGQAKQDNGVLILVAPIEREMRIEVGYGLEGILPDGLAGQVIQNDFLPHFRNNDYSGGIRSGTLRVLDIVAKQQVLTPEEIARLNDGSTDIPVWFIIPFLGLFVSIGFVMMGVGVRSKTGFPLLFGSFFGGMPMLMGLAVTSVTLYTLLPWAIGMFLLGLRLGARESWQEAFRGKGGSGSSGGWMMGGGSGGGGSSSSSGGSSSSFGGGSSGGGGASGRW